MPVIEMKTARITGKGQITIPKDLRQISGFKEGSKVCIIAFEDKIELRPMGDLCEKLFTAFASEKALSKDWKSKEDEEAWKDL